MQRPATLEQRHKSKDDDNQSPPWYAVAGKCAMGAVAHPLEYVRILIQLGHEPLEPKPTRRIFGKPALMLPSMFTYMGYIRRVDGFLGLYRGFSASLCCNLTQNIVILQLTAVMPPVPTFEEDQELNEEDVKIFHFIQRTSQQMVSRAVATLLSQPFYVISCRMMAQFIGGEFKYSSLYGSLREIIKDEGYSGLWNGLMPRLAGEVIRIWLAGSVAFFINNYIVDDASVRSYISGTTNFLASSLTYPFQLVGTVMSVSNAPIQAGGPPHLARYDGWTQCWKHLSQHGQLKRGSSLFWRYYQGPTRISPDGTAFKIPVDMSLLRKTN
ncbi:mitochondrial carrier2-like [Tropilaelaps mercedesae]|uniref:Mitochondrial carrier2-like n=1 Tax=Tropilaelaps mercedesae TaxID=418985 RepID=A0A1V9XWT7_9ACAR|nr:mitochondrial carrier2-like [Tropilaelaps mercedesae]